MGAINEILPKATGVGKVDPNSGGTGEIFNSYEDYMANKATGEYSHAEGCYNEAKGNYSHAEGYLTIASGNNAHAEGDGARANGYCSHAEGNSLANGRHSHAEGYSNSAMGDSSHAEGGQSDANGEYSHAEGFRTKTFSFAEHAEGTYNKSYDSEDAYVRVIHSVGIGSQENNRKNAHEIKFNGDHYIYGLGGYDGTETTGAQTLQEVINGKQDTLISGTSIKTINGESLLGSGDIEITGGSPDLVGKVDPNSDGTGELFNDYSNNKASGSYSHAEGSDNEASGSQAHVEGRYSKAIGDLSHAEGQDTNAEGQATHAEGYSTNANGTYAHAEGHSTRALGDFSHTEGYYTITKNSGEHAEGKYNKSNTGWGSFGTRHSVGIGSTESSRKNAHEIMSNGDHYVYGLGGYDGTNAIEDTAQTLQAVINSLSTITVDYNQPTTSYTGSDSTTIYKIFDLSSLKYTEGNDIILINGAQRLKYQYAYGETQAATVQVNETTSIEYNLINILSPLITNIFSLEELTIVHGKINAETDEKYYLIIEAVPTV